jgi:V/A-type H+-transporting ATPase subunit I
MGIRPLHHESLSDYYIENSFGVIETILSMLSKTISFVRIGAFALNHVGLFIAFKTISSMMRSSAGSFIVLLVGNIVIIGLEGLIVFIQGLRLEYYELFSRFYRGDGEEYNPIRLPEHNP